MDTMTYFGDVCPTLSGVSNRRVVVIGAGFAGLEVARALGKAGIGTTVVDRRNHHLFQPLLYQVATAALSAADIAEPIRRILRRYKSIQVIFGEVTSVDPIGRVVRLSCGRELAYDYLVVASGAGPSYFGHDEWSRWAPGLKTIEDARDIRSQVLLTFEKAERETDPVEQRRLMTIAVIGGGPTGVELAGSIAELSRYTLANDFRNITPHETRILLIEAGDRVLGAFPEDLSTYARNRLDRLGVTVLTGRRVEEVGPTYLTVSGDNIPAGFVIWAAGVAASPLGRKLGVETDRAGRVPVSNTLEVAGLDNVFALGDVAIQSDAKGKPLPGLAQVAKQQGIHLGRSLAGYIARRQPLRQFEYKSRGNTAIVGRHAAVYELGRFKLKGWVAWSAWAIIHVYLLVGFQHRFLVSMQWLWRYLTYERGARIIAGDFVETGDGKGAPVSKTRISV